MSGSIDGDVATRATGDGSEVEETVTTKPPSLQLKVLGFSPIEAVRPSNWHRLV